LETIQTYAKDLQDIAIRLVAGKLVAGTVEAEHELLRVGIRPYVVMQGVRHLCESIARDFKGETGLYEKFGPKVALSCTGGGANDEDLCGGVAG
jgi:hypothetical protein